MKSVSSALAAAMVGLLAIADAKVMESLRGVPAGWEAVGTPASDEKMLFRIAMHQPNEALFDQTLLDISTPGNAKYGQHLKREEVKALLRPHPHATKAVTDWLITSGVDGSRIVDDGEWINFYAPVRAAEQLLNTTFGVYRTKSKSMEKIRTLQYSVPAELHHFIDMIQPTTRFGELHGQRSFVLDVSNDEAPPVDLPGVLPSTEPPEQVASQGNAPEASSLAANVASIQADEPATDPVDLTPCNRVITPACLRALYRIPTYIPGLNLSAAGQIGIAGYLEQYARYSDFANFTNAYAPYLANSNFTYQLFNGGLDDQDSTSDSVEANLDAQYALALSYPVNATYYSTAGRGPLIPDLDQPEVSNNEPYLDFLTGILAQPDDELPHTLTTSYGENEQSVPEAYEQRVCSLFGQLGARGVSVIFSSGDTGPGSACQSNDGQNRTIFNPIFPASCPTVTSVGGTYGVLPERAVSFSSGGFSERYSRPTYQDAAVKAYLLSINDTFAGLYNRGGRGYPDVAAQGRAFRVFDKGSDISVSGTSASAPAFAGIVALLNAARRSQGLPNLGFLNPFLYGAAAGAFTDIVDGGSTGCTGTDQYSGLPAPYVPGAGWNATAGWDPVTGLGTPLFDLLLPAALAATPAPVQVAGNSTLRAYRVHKRS